MAADRFLRSLVFVLTDGVLQLALLIPADHRQVVDSSSEPVPNAILRFAGNSRPMRNGDFLHDCAGAVCEYRQEAMKTIESGNRFQDSALKNAQIAATVAEIHPQHCFAS